MTTKHRWRDNTGRCPTRLLGTERRVRVRLNNGDEPASSWPAWGKGACDWTLDPSYPYAIKQYRLEQEDGMPD